MIVEVLFPDGDRHELDDDAAHELADLLWGMTEQPTSATVAVLIQRELKRKGRRDRVEVPERNVSRVREALALLARFDRVEPSRPAAPPSNRRRD